MSRLLTDDEITRQLRTLPDWTLAGATLVADLESPTFPAAVALVGEAADAAEAMNHHPDIDIRWRSTHWVLSTHSAGGLTSLDIELAHHISDAASRLGARRKGASTL